MREHEWSALDIFSALSKPRTHNFGTDVTILKIDEKNMVVIGYKDDGSVFFGCPQIGDIAGFKKGRATLEIKQTIDLNKRGLIEPAFALSFLINSEDELRAISTIFAGLYDLNIGNFGSSKATEAAQGFEKYFADLPKIGLTKELEIGLFGELCLIATSSKKDELIRGWHTSPNSTFDFSFAGKRLEVKTSTRPTRLVWLRSSQTIKNADSDLTYLSIYAPLDDAGINIFELVKQIRNEVSTTHRSLFDDKLSFYDIENSQLRFDYEAASSGFRFISSAEVPYPPIDDSRIIELRWKCSFLTLSNDVDPSFWI